MLTLAKKKLPAKSKKAANAYKKFLKTADQTYMPNWERDEDGHPIAPDALVNDIEADDEDDDYVPPKHAKDIEDDDFDDISD